MGWGGELMVFMMSMATFKKLFSGVTKFQRVVTFSLKCADIHVT